MIIRAIETKRIHANQTSIAELVDEYIPVMHERSVLAVTSKIVSLCEGSIMSVDGTDKAKLVHQESDLVLPDASSQWGINFSIRNGILIPNAGIDESNAGDVYVLWPKNVQHSANTIRSYLSSKFGLKDIGVIVTDSTVRPLRKGVSGIAIAYSGFSPLRDYVQTPDLFGRPFAVAQADVVGGLAASAVLIMGEGSESTPMAMIQELPNVEFTTENPSSEELQALSIPLEEDLFAPFLTNARWEKGGHTDVE